MKERKPGTVNESRIPIYDHEGNQRGHVGPKATALTVSRFINQHGAKLGKKDGRQAWIGPKPPPPKPIKPAMPVQPAASTAAQKLEISVKGAMGSASKTPAKKKPKGS